MAERILIIGSGPRAHGTARVLQRAPGAELVGFVGIPGEAADANSNGFGSLELGSIDELPELVRRETPDRLVVALSERRTRLPLNALLALRGSGLEIEDAAPACERITGKLDLDATVPSDILFSRDFQKSRWSSAFLRIVSVVFAAIGLSITAALLFVPIALLIKLESPGPVFFTQRRIGRFGRTFRMFKFRTMREAEGEGAAGFARNDDARVTRFGRFLRQFYLDELPQLFNVLRGDMNVVGPRPEMAVNAERMIDQVPYFELRHLVRPGLTGWAQVNVGYSVSKLAVTDKIAYDLYYVKHRSLGFDLRILLRTVGTVLSGWHGGAAHAVNAEDGHGGELVPARASRESSPTVELPDRGGRPLPSGHAYRSEAS